MKILTTALGMLLMLTTHAQTIITGRIKHTIPGTQLTVNVPFDGWIFDNDSKDTLPDASGGFTISVPLQHPQFVVLKYGEMRIKVYAEPSKKIMLNFDAADYKNTLLFSGDLATENTLCKQTGLSYFQLTPKTWNDSTTNPWQILEEMKKAQAASFQALVRAKPITTEGFATIAKAEIQYFPAAKLVELSFNNNAWTTRDTTANHFSLSVWKQAINKAYDANPLSNDSAINSYNYMSAINNLPFFVQRKFDKREELVPLAEKIMGESFDEAMKDLRAKGKSYWDYKVYNYYLTGSALQKSLASFINRKIHLGELEYLDEAYNDFITRFPTSEYLGFVQQTITPYLLAKARAGDAGETTFITDTALTFNKLVSAFKGNVVVVDMWGTWCPACRDEMGYATALKEKFKGKPITYIYIAVEHNTNPEKNWRQTVRFFNLSGTHVLANSSIKTQVEDMYKNNGMVYPTYILIDKNGNIANANAAFPSSGEKLYTQIEALL
jgi:thiol-disulfide isomerase/thioredoxin